MARRVTPIRGRGGQDTQFRYIERKNKGTDWASCGSSYSFAFRNSRRATFTRGFYLSNADLGLIGLGLAVLVPPALAFVGPTGPAMLFTTGTGLSYSVTSVGQGLIAAGAAAGLAGALRPTQPVGATFASDNKPCVEY